MIGYASGLKPLFGFIMNRGLKSAVKTSLFNLVASAMIF